MPTFKCRDIGYNDGFEISASSEEELMQKIKEHVAKAHGMQRIPPEMQERIRKAINK